MLNFTLCVSRRVDLPSGWLDRPPPFNRLPRDLLCHSIGSGFQERSFHNPIADFHNWRAGNCKRCSVKSDLPYCHYSAPSLHQLRYNGGVWHDKHLVPFLPQSTSLNYPPTVPNHDQLGLHVSWTCLHNPDSNCWTSP